MFTTGSVRKIYVKWIIAIFLAVIVYIAIPVNALISAQMRLFLAITLFAIELMALDLIDMLLFGLLLPGLYLILNVATPEIVYSSWNSNMLFMILGAFILANIMEEVGLLKRVAYFLLKISGGSFNKLIYTLFAVCVIVNFMTFTNSYIIMATLILGICTTLGYDNLSKEASVLFTVGYLGNITTKLYIYFPGYNGLIKEGLNLTAEGFVIHWYTNFIYNWPVIIFSLLFIYSMCKALKVNDKAVSFEGGKEYFHKQYELLGKMSAKEKKTSVVFIILLVFLFSSPLHSIPIDYIFMLVPIILYLPGIDVGTDSAIRKCNFKLLFFMAACLSIGKIGSYLGVSHLFSELIIPILEGKSSVMILFLSYIFGMVANVFMTPVAILATFTAPLAKVAVDFGISPLVMTMSLLTSVDALFLPYESGTALAYCGFGILAMNKIVKIFLFKLCAFSVFLLVVLIPYWLVVFS